MSSSTIFRSENSRFPATGIRLRRNRHTVVVRLCSNNSRQGWMCGGDGCDGVDSGCCCSGALSWWWTNLGEL
ncbi:hypothetical protein HanIR_Chr07g0322421 [Helianthus annuus]|nr:hypothetical protein HanIR_Chr07g0322421 [Helianthus annuus]